MYGAYAGSRTRTIALLEDLPPKGWQRTGEHEEFGKMTIQKQASYFAVHELTHLPQIEALVNQHQ